MNVLTLSFKYSYSTVVDYSRADHVLNSFIELSKFDMNDIPSGRGSTPYLLVPQGKC